MTYVKCIEVVYNVKWMLDKTGLYPAKVITKLVVIKLILAFILYVIFYGAILLNILIAIRKNDTALLNWMTWIILTITNYYSKVAVIVFRKATFYSILEDLKSKEFNSHKEEFNKNIQRVDEVTKILFRYFVVTMMSSLTTFSLLPFVTDGLLVIPAPFDTGNFDVVYKIAHFIICVYMTYNCIGIDMLYMMLFGLCAAEIDILREKIFIVLQCANLTHTRCQQQIEVHLIVDELLKECVILHEKINKFAEKIGYMLSFPMFMQFVTGCLMVCYSILELTFLGDGSSSKAFGISSYLFIVIAQMSVYNWLGNEVIVKSELIVDACYLSTWYQMDIKAQKTLLLLMERARRPLVIKAYNLIFISLESLLVIIRWSYSVFAVFRTKYN